MNLILIADFFIEDYKGGAEYADFAFIESLKRRNIEVLKMRCFHFNEWIKKNDLNDKKIIFCNFSGLENDTIKKVIESKCQYIIYEYDHKYLKSRDSARYLNNHAPISEIIHVNFYKNALRVFPQTEEHAKILFKHLNIKNLSIVHGSMWSDEELDWIKQCLIEKQQNFNINQEDFVIIDNDALNKGTFDSISLAQKQKWKYKLIKNNKSYKDFIKELSNYSKFIFTPKCFEACSRIALEARMLEMKVVLNDNVPVKKEQYFSQIKGFALIDYLRQMREDVVTEILDLFNGEKIADYEFCKENDIVSIVAPSHNDAPYLDKFFENILAQTYPNIELIFVNDCSTDNTNKIVEKWINKFKELNSAKQIKLISLPQNGGTGNALNVGFKESIGFYQTWWSTDDEKENSCIEDLVSILKQEKDVDYVVSSYFSERYNSNWRSFYKINDKLWSINQAGFTETINYSDEYILLKNKEWAHISSGQCHAGTCFMWKAPLLFCCGEFDRVPGEDYVMSALMGMKANQVAYLDKCLGVHKCSPDSLTSTQPMSSNNSIEKVRELYRLWIQNN